MLLLMAYSIVSEIVNNYVQAVVYCICKLFSCIMYCKQFNVGSSHHWVKLIFIRSYKIIKSLSLTQC